MDGASLEGSRTCLLRLFFYGGHACTTLLYFKVGTARGSTMCVGRVALHQEKTEKAAFVGG